MRPVRQRRGGRAHCCCAGSRCGTTLTPLRSSAPAPPPPSPAPAPAPSPAHVPSLPLCSPVPSPSLLLRLLRAPRSLYSSVRAERYSVYGRIARAPAVHQPPLVPAHSRGCSDAYMCTFPGAPIVTISPRAGRRRSESDVKQDCAKGPDQPMRDSSNSPTALKRTRRVH